MLDDLTDEERDAALAAVIQVRRRKLVETFGADRFYVYAPLQDTDLTEGRGPHVPRGHFFLDVDAQEAAGLLETVQGVPAPKVIVSVPIFRSVDEWLGHLPARVVLTAAGRTRKDALDRDRIEVTT